jgi:hypothetical protein
VVTADLRVFGTSAVSARFQLRLAHAATSAHLVVGPALISRQAAGDWGNAGAFDWCENERALREGLGVGVDCRRPGAFLREVPSAQPLVRPTGSERQVPGSRGDSPEGLCLECASGQTCDNRG